MAERKLRFKVFLSDPNYTSTKSLQEWVDKFFVDYDNIEIVSQSQSQSGGFITLSVFFRADKKEPEE